MVTGAADGALDAGPGSVQGPRMNTSRNVARARRSMTRARDVQDQATITAQTPWGLSPAQRHDADCKTAQAIVRGLQGLLAWLHEPAYTGPVTLTSEQIREGSRGRKAWVQFGEDSIGIRRVTLSKLAKAFPARGPQPTWILDLRYRTLQATWERGRITLHMQRIDGSSRLFEPARDSGEGVG